MIIGPSTDGDEISTENAEPVNWQNGFTFCAYSEKTGWHYGTAKTYDEAKKMVEELAQKIN